MKTNDSEEDRKVRPPTALSRNRKVMGWLRVILPTVAVLSVGLIFFWPQIKESSGDFGLKSSDRRDSDTSSSRLIGPRFEGVDEKGRPYNLTATTANYASGSKRYVELDNPKGDLFEQDGSWVRLTALSGMYDRQAEDMDLQGNVNLSNDEGFEIMTSSAYLELSQGRAEGHEPVNGLGPGGHIISQGFRLEDEGRVIYFTGESKLTLFDEKKKEASSATPDQGGDREQ